MRLRPKPAGPESGPGPILVADAEIAGPLAALPATSPDGRSYSSSHVLLLAHGTPIAQLKLDAASGSTGWTAVELRNAITEQANDAVGAHLAADGIDETAISGSEGAQRSPTCLTSLTEFLRTAPPVSVVIPTRNRPERLRDSVRSILSGSYPADRLSIFVVDNVPRDDRTLKAVQGLARLADVRYLVEVASGSASARNRALPEISTDIVAFTDDDADCDANWIAQTVRGFSAQPDVGIVTGLVVPKELDTPAQVWFEEYGGFSRGFDRRVFDLTENVPDDPLYPYTAGIFGTGNNMAFRTDVLRDIGGFDPGLGNGTPALGGVDSEVLFRSVVLGHRLVYEPRSFVRHSHRADYEALRRQIYAYGAGQTGYLTKMMLAQPRLAPGLVRRIPRGLSFAFSDRGGKNAHKSSLYPRELTVAEIRGLLYGPIGYARSRRRYGPHRVGPTRPGTPTPR